MIIMWQESAELGQFKEFMVKYNKVYSSQEGAWLTCLHNVQTPQIISIT